MDHLVASALALKKRKQIGFRFMAVLLSFGALIIAVLLIHTFLLYRESREVAERFPRESAARIAAEADKMLGTIETNLELVPSFVDDELQVPSFMVTLFQQQLPVLRLTVFDIEGREQWAHDFLETDAARASVPLPEARDTERALFFAKALRGERYLSAPFYSARGIPQILWALPVRGEGGVIRGVLAAHIDLRPLVSILTYEEDLFTRLIDTQGATLWPIRESGAAAPSLLEKAPVDIAFARGDGRVFSYTNPAGVSVLAAWEPLERIDWAVVAEVPARRVYENVYLSLTILVSLGVVVLAMLVFTARFFQTYVHQPLMRMREGVERFAQGDLEARIEEGRRDELGLLARAFNAMAQRIANEPSRLRKEVERRTKELEQANEKLQHMVGQVQNNAKALLEKEQKLIEANERLQELNRDMDRVGKALVRRDKELSAANARLEELDKMKSEFVSVAAHQLRTPLTGIRWSLMGLANGELGSLSDEQKNTVKNGLTAAEAAISLINDLLDTARMEGGRFGYEFRVAPLRDTLASAVSRLVQRAHHKGITLTTNFPPEDLCMNHDQKRLEMALENAIDNAIKYTEPPGMVKISYAREDDEKVALRVQDSGIGIPKNEQHRLFSKFFRAPNAQLMQTSGTGLGLYLMKKIVERHGGEVAIESEEGKGTTVIFTFPLVPCVSPEEKEKEGEGAEAKETREAPEEEKGEDTIAMQEAAHAAEKEGTEKGGEEDEEEAEEQHGEKKGRGEEAPSKKPLHPRGKKGTKKKEKEN